MAASRESGPFCGLMANFYSLMTKKIPMERGGIRSLFRILYDAYVSYYRDGSWLVRNVMANAKQDGS